MASEVSATDLIALTEKKMNMTLDEIIKMSKNKTSQGRRPRRQPQKQRFLKSSASQAKNKVQRYMDSRSSVRQGVLAQRRSKFQGNQFHVTKETARKAASVPFRSRPARWNNSRRAALSNTRRIASAALSNTRRGGFGIKDKVYPNQKPQTLDARFANIKEHRMKVVSQQIGHRKGRQMAQRRNGHMHQHFRAMASNQRASHFSSFTRR